MMAAPLPEGVVLHTLFDSCHRCGPHSARPLLPGQHPLAAAAVAHGVWLQAGRCTARCPGPRAPPKDHTPCNHPHPQRYRHGPAVRSQVRRKRSGVLAGVPHVRNRGRYRVPARRLRVSPRAPRWRGRQPVRLPSVAIGCQQSPLAQCLIRVAARGWGREGGGWGCARRTTRAGGACTTPVLPTPRLQREPDGRGHRRDVAHRLHWRCDLQVSGGGGSLAPAAPHRRGAHARRAANRRPRSGRRCAASELRLEPGRATQVCAAAAFPPSHLPAASSTLSSATGPTRPTPTCCST